MGRTLTSMDCKSIITYSAFFTISVFVVFKIFFWTIEKLCAII